MRHPFFALPSVFATVEGTYNRTTLRPTLCIHHCTGHTYNRITLRPPLCIRQFTGRTYNNYPSTLPSVFAYSQGAHITVPNDIQNARPHNYFGGYGYILSSPDRI